MFIISNLVTIRTDAFLQNLIDFSYILTYSFIIYSFIGVIAHSEIQIGTVMFLSVVTNALYSIVYVINGYVDYKSDAKNSDPYSLYRYRPITYFRKTKVIVTYLIGLYIFYFRIAYEVLLQKEIPFIAVFIVSLTFISILHSLYRSTLKFIMFCLLRLTKYMLLLVVMHVVIFNGIYVYPFFLVLTSLVLPYTLHASFIYGRNKNLIGENGIEKYYITLMLITVLLTLVNVNIANAIGRTYIYVIEAIVFSHLLTSAPLVILRTALRYIFGSESKHILAQTKILTITIILVILIYALVIYLMRNI